jgi:hypothetical protein
VVTAAMNHARLTPVLESVYKSTSDEHHYACARFGTTRGIHRPDAAKLSQQKQTGVCDANLR